MIDASAVSSSKSTGGKTQIVPTDQPIYANQFHKTSTVYKCGRCADDVMLFMYESELRAHQQRVHGCQQLAAATSGTVEQLLAQRQLDANQLQVWKCFSCVLPLVVY